MELFLRTSKLRYRATLPDVQCSEDRNLQPDKLASLADAILDRIIPKAHRIELKGKSRRKNLNQVP